MYRRPRHPAGVGDLRPSGCRSNGEHMRGIWDVLQPLLSKVDELGGNHSAHMPPRIGGDADSAGWGEALEAGRDIDAVAINVVRRHDDVAEIYADAKLMRRSCGRSALRARMTRCIS